MTRAPLLLALIVAMPLARAAAQAPAQSGSGRAPAFAAPGDRIQLKVYREEELSDSLIVVDARGEAVFPKIGVVAVSRIPIGVLRDSLRVRFARYLREPDVDVVVLRRIAVSGDVRLPNVFYLDPSATLRDAIARAGGITPDGDPKRLHVVREGQRIKVPDWRRADGDAFDLRSGDQVVVGTKPWLVRNALGLASTAAIVVSVTTAVLRGS